MPLRAVSDRCSSCKAGVRNTRGLGDHAPGRRWFSTGRIGTTNQDQLNGRHRVTHITPNGLALCGHGLFGQFHAGRAAAFLLLYGARPRGRRTRALQRPHRASLVERTVHALRPEVAAGWPLRKVSSKAIAHRAGRPPMRAAGARRSRVPVRLPAGLQAGRAGGRVGEPGAEGGHVGVGQTDLDGDVLAVAHVPDVAAGGAQVVLDLPGALVVDGDGDQAAPAPGDRADGVQGLADGAAVRAEEAAGAQFDPAVGAGGGGGDVAHLAAQQHLEHGHAGGAAGLSVVVGLLDGGVGPDDVGPAVVGGVGVLLAHGRDEVLRLLLGGRRGEGAQEAGAVDLGLVHTRARDGAVLVLHPASLCAAPRRGRTGYGLAPRGTVNEVSRAEPAVRSGQPPRQARTAIAEVGNLTRTRSRVSSSPSPARVRTRSSSPGLCPISRTVRISSGTSCSTARSSGTPAMYRRRSKRTGGGGPHGADAPSQVRRTRTAVVPRAWARSPPASARARPATGASRRPRAERGRSWSATPSGQADLAWRRTKRRRSGPAPVRSIMPVFRGRG